MSEVFIGILAMAAFIGFVIWKNKGKAKQEEDIHSQQWWAEREQEAKEGPVIVRADADRDGDDD
ncbi:MAG: hypothetical protein ACLFT5_03970 [Desulfovermiculus sp.]